MAWVVPQTWVIGELVSATDLNEQIRDNMNHLKTVLDDNGKIYALSTTYFASLDASQLTGVAKLNANNDFTAGVHDFDAGSGTRLVVPVGANLWAT